MSDKENKENEESGEGEELLNFLKSGSGDLDSQPVDDDNINTSEKPQNKNSGKSIKINNNKQNLKINKQNKNNEEPVDDEPIEEFADEENEQDEDSGQTSNQSEDLGEGFEEETDEDVFNSLGIEEMKEQERNRQKEANLVKNEVNEKRDKKEAKDPEQKPKDTSKITEKNTKTKNSKKTSKKSDDQNTQIDDDTSFYEDSDEESNAKRESSKKGILGKLFGSNKDKGNSNKSKKKPKNKSNKISKKATKSNKKKDKNKKVDINKTEKISEESLTEEERIELTNRRYKNMKLKKFLTTGIILTTVGSILLFGVYNTFIDQEKTPQQLAAEVNAVNRDTPFPSEGIDGFLKKNINEMIDKNVSLDKEVSQMNIDPENLYVTSIAKKSAYIANVYFTAKVETDKGQNYHNFFVPIYYDYDEVAYNPAGEVHITPVNPKDDIEIVNNNYLSFEDIKKMPEDETDNAKSFIENFFTILFNEEGDISPYYKGNESIGDTNAEYSHIESFNYYQSKNKNNYNVEIEYVLELNEGFTFKVVNYLNLEKSGDSYIIKGIL